jgi:hypothetical protein
MKRGVCGMAVDLEQKRQALEAWAARERNLIEDEIAAERELLKAQQRLAKIEGEYEEIKRERNERMAKVATAKAMLAAVQRRRAEGPSKDQFSSESSPSEAESPSS